MSVVGKGLKLLQEPNLKLNFKIVSGFSPVFIIIFFFLNEFAVFEAVGSSKIHKRDFKMLQDA